MAKPSASSPKFKVFLIVAGWLATCTAPKTWMACNCRAAPVHDRLTKSRGGLGKDAGFTRKRLVCGRDDSSFDTPPLPISSSVKNSEAPERCGFGPLQVFAFAGLSALWTCFLAN